jgi:hypothetical protein
MAESEPFQKIPTIIDMGSRRRQRFARPRTKRARNLNNLIQIETLPPTSTSSIQTNFSDTQHVPKVLLTNVMSLVPKVEELREFILRYEISLAFITETWLKGLIQDSVVTIPGYTTFRKGREKDNQGWVCAYINHNVGSYSQLNDLNCCE